MVRLQRERGEVFVAKIRVLLRGALFLAKRLERELLNDICKLSVAGLSSQQILLLYLSGYRL